MSVAGQHTPFLGGARSTFLAHGVVLVLLLDRPSVAGVAVPLEQGDILFLAMFHLTILIKNIIIFILGSVAL